MSMIGEYRRMTPQRLDELQEALRDNPEAMSEYLYPEEPTYEKPDPQLEIAKSWHGIHFLLNGKPWEGQPPLHNTVLGGTEFGEELGYGPARYLMPQQVREVSDALVHLEKSGLRKQFDPAAFEAAEIYPGGWTVGEPEKAFDWLWKNLLAVREFFREAAQHGDVMLLYLS